MKTKWIIIPVLALAFGCTKEIEDGITYIDGVFSLYATSGENQTRTVLQQDGSIFWSPSDCINVFYGNLSGKFTSDNTRPAESAEFKGLLGAFALDGQTEFIAAYPYSEETTLSGNALGISLPAEQTAVEGTFADDLFICVAKSKDYNLFFFNVCGGVKFSLSRDDVKKVVFRGNDGESLAGRLDVGFSSDGKPQVNGIHDGSTSVTLVAPDGGTFKSGVFYYLVLAPQSLSKGYTMEFYGDGLLGTESSDSPVTVRRSAWGVLKNLSPEAPETPDPSDALVVLERKYFLMNTTAYSYQGGIHFLSPRTIIDSEKGNFLQIFYWNDDYVKLYGVYIFYSDSSGIEKQVYLTDVKYDEWVKEKIVIAADGTVRYYMDGALLFDQRLDLPLLKSSQTVSVSFNPYGWWYTHYHFMDDFSLKTPEAQISDDFNDGVIDLTIWEQPANPDGVFEEEGYLQMVQKRTDVDFSLRSKPISLGSVILNPDEVPEAIDLGLSVKWASFNLGARAPEERGDHYAWGETEPYYSSLNPLTWKEGKESGYDWPSYKWSMGSGNTINKYCNDSQYGYNGFKDDKTVLEPEDDAAHVTLGDGWRIPTEEEMNELRNRCVWEWTTINGVGGRLVTGPNGNSIFLPSAGARYVTYLYDADGGYYSTSSLYNYSPEGAYVAYFNSDYVSGSGWLDRNRGFSIRPVHDDGALTSVRTGNPTSIGPCSAEIPFAISTAESIYGFGVIYSTDNSDPVVGNLGDGDYLMYISSEIGSSQIINELKPNTTYYARAFITLGDERGKKVYGNTVQFTTKELSYSSEHEDLGLSVSWATCNLGSSSPSDVGAYYAWGETVPTSLRAAYKWSGTNGFTKYNADDGKVTLDASDDAASVNLGGNWRMPTVEEIDELRNRCTWTPATRDGVRGCTVTGPNGKSIFIPVSEGSTLSFDAQFLSSTLFTGYDNYHRVHALIYYYASSSAGSLNTFRDWGVPIRPVYVYGGSNSGGGEPEDVGYDDWF